MKTIHYLIFCSIIISLSACNPQAQSKDKTESSKSNHFISKTYKQSRFEDDRRAEKIKTLSLTIKQLTEEHRKSKNIPGIAYGIVVDNELVISDATGFINLNDKLPASSQSSFRIASMTKSFTAMAIMKLRDEGKLSLSDPAEKYIPEMSGLEYLTSDAPVINIKNLLTMTAGFPEDNPWGDRQLDESDQMLMNLLTDGVSFSNPASFNFEYSNTGYALLGYIISRISGKPFQEYIKENILQPLNMEHTYWEYDSVPKEQLAIGYRWEDEQWKTEPMLHDGTYGAMGGLITSIEDFSKYVSFHLSAWPPRSGEETGPIKRSSLREMHTSQYSDLYANAVDFNGNPCALMSGYGYGLRIAEYCNGLKLVSHGGALPGFGSNYILFPEYGVGIMAFCNLTYTSAWPVKAIAKLLFETLDLKPRQLPVSDILRERQEQITQLIQNWDTIAETNFLAENFYLDKSKKHRMAEAEALLKKAGPIQSIDELFPTNQLRGTYKIHAENGVIEVFFTLTPKKNPKVQQLDLSFQPN